MIEIAESRGLFGKNPSGRTKGAHREKSKKQEKIPTPPQKRKGKNKTIEVISLFSDDMMTYFY